MRYMLLAIALFMASAMAEDRPGQPRDEHAYNVNEFTASGEALGDGYDDFATCGKATRVHNAWRQVQSMVDHMATCGKIPNRASFRVVVRWRGKDFSRVVVAHGTRAIITLYVGPSWVIVPRGHHHCAPPRRHCPPPPRHCPPHRGHGRQHHGHGHRGHR
jgi:hypothetical protein